MRPETRFTRSDGLYIAYQALGSGEREFVVAFGGPSHLEAVWDIPEFAGFLQQLAEMGRVAVFDKRGVGLSDRITQPATVEDNARDIVAVMDAAGLQKPVLFGSVDAACACLVVAALHPERVTALVAVEATATFVPDEHDPWGFSPQAAEMLRTSVAEGWGQGLALRMFAGRFAEDPRIITAWQRLERMAATPATAAWWLESMLNVDVRSYLDSVKVPVLLLHARDNAYADVTHIKRLADHLPNARIVELEGDLFEIMLSGGPVLDELEDFVAGTRLGGSTRRELVALHVTDLVGSTVMVKRMGEHGWRRTLEDHREVVRQSLRRYNGTEIDTAGDGFLATFRLPSQAMKCAAEIRDASTARGVAVRQGVHVGEVTIFDGGVAGEAVHAAARIAALAGAGDVYVSDAALRVSAGDHPPAVSVGVRTLRGLGRGWRLHRLVTPTDAHEPPIHDAKLVSP